MEAETERDGKVTIFERVRLYLAYLKARMRLTDWEIVLDEDEAQERAMADIGVVPGRKVATLRLCRGFEGLSPQQQRHAMVHELNHVHLFRMVLASEDCEEYMSRREYRRYRRGLYREMEYAVDGVSDYVAPLLATMQDLEDGLYKDEMMDAIDHIIPELKPDPESGED
jgi:hypothetical protein